jgi:hypothetical protein
LKPAWANSSQDPISKKPITKKGWCSGSGCSRVQMPIPQKKKSAKQRLLQIQMFILHKNLTKWAAGCTKTFGEGVEGEVAVEKGNTDSGHSHWAGAKLRKVGPTDTAPSPLRALACTLLACQQERGLGGAARLDWRSPTMARVGGGPPWLAAEYCIRDT